MPRIMVAMPAHNEARYIGTMVLLCREYADLVLVVDNASTDLTGEVATLAGAMVVKHSEKGYGSSIRRIITEARRLDWDALVILDADTQHNPKDIPVVANKVLEGYDLVIGSRSPENIPAYRKIGQRFLSILTRASTRHSKVSDTQSGFRGFSPRAVNQLFLKNKGMAVSSEMVSNADFTGLKVTEVQVSVEYTKDGSTINPVVQGVDTLTQVLSMISERKPLVFFGGGGLVLILAGVLAGITGYKMFLVHEILPVGTLLLSVLLTIIGMLSAFTGIILHTVVKSLTK